MAEGQDCTCGVGNPFWAHLHTPPCPRSEAWNALPAKTVSEAEVDRAHDIISDIGPDEQFVPGFRDTDFYKRIRKALEDFRNG
jgi:hypothetical protein